MGNHYKQKRDQPRKQCHDCAFLPGSPEQTFRKHEMDQILLHLDGALKEEHGYVPFYCHQGMPMAPDGSYVPKTNESGEPVKGKLCMGWVNEMTARYAKRQEETKMLSPKLIVSVMLLAAALAGGFGRARVKPATVQHCSMFSPCAMPSEDTLKP